MATKAQRAAVKKYDAEHMAYQTVKVRRQLLDDFKAACAARGHKVNSILREAMENYVKTAPTVDTNGANGGTVAGLTNDETLLLLGQLAADVEELQAIADTATVDNETREQAAKNANVVMALFGKIAAALPDEQKRPTQAL